MQVRLKVKFQGQKDRKPSTITKCTVATHIILVIVVIPFFIAFPLRIVNAWSSRVFRSRPQCAGGDVTRCRHDNEDAPVIMIDSSRFIQLSEMGVVPLIVGGSATVIPGTTLHIHCHVINAQSTYTHWPAINAHDPVMLNEAKSSRPRPRPRPRPKIIMKKYQINND